MLAVLDSLVKTQYEGDVRFIVDSDDSTEEEYYFSLKNWIANNNFSFRIYRNIVPSSDRRGCVAALNRVVPFILSEYDVIHFQGDDHRAQTVGWHKKFEEALSNPKTQIVYGDDRVQGKNLPTEFSVKTGFVKALGKFIPADLDHLWFDNLYRDIGLDLNVIEYLPQVVIQHFHPIAGKAEWDEGYKAVNDPGKFAKDAQEYQRWWDEDWPTLKQELIDKGF